MSKNTIFGEEQFLDNTMIDLIEQRGNALDNLVFEQMENTIRCSGFIPMPHVVINKDKLRKWVTLCAKLDNIEHSDLVDVATQKRILDLKDERDILEKALELACLYVFENEFDESADKESCVKDMIDVFKTKAKEMMKSE